MVSIQETIPQSSAGAVSVHAHLAGGREGGVGTAGPVGLAWSRTLPGSGHCERLPGQLGAAPPAVTVPPAVGRLRSLLSSSGPSVTPLTVSNGANPRARVRGGAPRARRGESPRRPPPRE